METISTIVHSDPGRAAYGYDGGDRYDRSSRALEAVGVARIATQACAELIAYATVAGRDTSPAVAQHYRKAKAGLAYAQAVNKVTFDQALGGVA